jgi:hypothetical protein
MEYGDWVIVRSVHMETHAISTGRINPVLKNLKDTIGHMSDLKRPYMMKLSSMNYFGEGRFFHYDGWEYKLRHILINKMGL